MDAKKLKLLRRMSEKSGSVLEETGMADNDEEEATLLSTLVSPFVAEGLVDSPPKTTASTTLNVVWPLFGPNSNNFYGTQ